jgi:hypothetical protein
MRKYDIICYTVLLSQKLFYKQLFFYSILLIQLNYNLFDIAAFETENIIFKRFALSPDQWLVYCCCLLPWCSRWFCLEDTTWGCALRGQQPRFGTWGWRQTWRARLCAFHRPLGVTPGFAIGYRNKENMLDMTCQRCSLGKKSQLQNRLVFGN